MSDSQMYVYVPPEERGTWWYIFRQHFRCMVRDIDYYDEETLAEEGVIGIPDPVEHKNSMLEFKHKDLTINTMVAIHSAGGSIKIPSPDTAKEIHERIQDHLEVFANVSGIPNADIPTEELLLLNEFDLVVCKSIPSMLKVARTGSALDALRAIIPNVNFSAIENKSIKPLVKDDEIDPTTGVKKVEINRRDFTSAFKNNDWSRF